MVSLKGQFTQIRQGVACHLQRGGTGIIRVWLVLMHLSVRFLPQPKNNQHKWNVSDKTLKNGAANSSLLIFLVKKIKTNTEIILLTLLSVQTNAYYFPTLCARYLCCAVFSCFRELIRLSQKLNVFMTPFLVELRQIERMIWPIEPQTGWQRQSHTLSLVSFDDTMKTTVMFVSLIIILKKTELFSSRLKLKSNVSFIALFLMKTMIATDPQWKHERRTHISRLSVFWVKQPLEDGTSVSSGFSRCSLFIWDSNAACTV